MREYLMPKLGQMRIATMARIRPCVHDLGLDVRGALAQHDDPDTYPIQPKPHTMEYLREVAHLRPRTNVIGAATRVRHTLALAIHRFFDENGFFWVNTPIITSSDAEGAGALFRVSTLDLANLPRTPQGKIDFAQDFFGREALLTVSGQLNVEAYYCPTASPKSEPSFSSSSKDRRS